MILRIMVILFLVCGWGAAQTPQGTEELGRRLLLIDAERLRGDLVAAESMLAKVQAEIERTEGPGVKLAMALRAYGHLRDDQARPGEAIAFYERSLAMLRATTSAEPAMTAMLLAELAGSHSDRGDTDVALSLSAEALTLLRNATERATPSYPAALYAHGVALHNLGRNTEALPELREAFEVWRRAADPDSAHAALANEGIADCLSALGYHTRAEAAARETLALLANVDAPDSLPVGASLNNLGVILAREQRWSEGEQALERAAAIFERFGSSQEHRLATVLGNLGGLYYDQARISAPLYAKAEAAYRRKLAIEERMFGPSDVRLFPTLEMLGEVLYRERAYNEAGRLYSRGLAIQTSAFGSTDPKALAAAKRYNVLAKKMSPGVAR